MSEIVRFSTSPELFAAADRLYSVVEASLRQWLPWSDVRHIGSTAVPGTLTKGDLDIVVRVSPSEFLKSEKLLSEAYERNEGSDRTDDFAAFMDKSTIPELGIQLVVRGSSSDIFHAWLDRLLADQTLRRDYDQLKNRFQGGDMEAYREAKAQFIADRLFSFR